MQQETPAANQTVDVAVLGQEFSAAELSEYLCYVLFDDRIFNLIHLHGCNNSLPASFFYL